jgi:hypothetical protein
MGGNKMEVNWQDKKTLGVGIVVAGLILWCCFSCNGKEEAVEQIKHDEYKEVIED